MKHYLRNPFVIFSPFLFVFIVLVCRMHTEVLSADGLRYYQFAENLIKGYYSPPGELNLWNGPGYPVVLMPFVAFDLPKILIVLMNAVLQYLSIILVFKTLLLFVKRRTALIASLFWALYYPSYQEMGLILAETLTLFLTSAIMYCYATGFSRRPRVARYYAYGGLLLGYLILTKVIFWYVLLLLTLAVAVMLLISRRRPSGKGREWKMVCMSMVLAYLVIAPYLWYTYTLTGRPFYLANSGGMSLYWMSTPYEGEYGDWNSETFEANCLPEWELPCNAEYFRRNHETNIRYVQQFTGIEKDDAYKRLAMQHIKKHPVKYLRNCVANMGRLWFNFPFSYFFQRDKVLLRFPPNAILLTGFLLALPFYFYRLRSYKPAVHFVFVFTCLYLGFSMLVSAYQRQFYVIVPLVVFWETCILTSTFAFRTSVGKAETPEAGSDNMIIRG